MKIVCIVMSISLAIAVSSCQHRSDHGASTQSKVLISEQAVASNQSIQCSFKARVISLAKIKQPLPPTNRLEGYLIDEEPEWEVDLDVLPHQQKIPFQPGLRKCYIADIVKVFNAQPDEVQGEYEFSFTWNIDVPGKREFELFQARRK
jgi:hypothetical protein